MPSWTVGLPFISTRHLYLNHKGTPVMIYNKMQPIDQMSIFFSNSHYSLPFYSIISNSGGMYSGVIVLILRLIRLWADQITFKMLIRNQLV